MSTFKRAIDNCLSEISKKINKEIYTKRKVEGMSKPDKPMILRIEGRIHRLKAARKDLSVLNQQLSEL